MGKKQKTFKRRAYKRMLQNKCIAMNRKKREHYLRKQAAKNLHAAGYSGRHSHKTQEIREFQYIEIENHNFQGDNIKEEVDTVVETEEIEETVENGDGSNKNDEESGFDVPCQTQFEEENDAVFEPEEIEETIDSGDGTETNDEPGSDAPCQTPSNEELWLVRKQLCRGCHSDGAFWSLQTTTEGDTYEDLFKTYLNIQLCPVSADERVLSAICALCAARLRDARAFSVQARAAEERFTRFYAQNRVRVLSNEDEIKGNPQIKSEVEDIETTADVEPDTANIDLGDELSTEEVGPKTQVLCDKPTRKILFRLSESDYEGEGSMFRCTRCHKLYTKNTIHNHVKNVHMKLPKYKCSHCDKTFTYLVKFKEHKTVEHSNIFESKLKKKEESKLSPSVSNVEFKNHKNEHSNILERELKRTRVFKLSPSDFKLVGNSYKCTRCDKQFKQYSQVRNHVKYSHLNLPRYACSHCGQTFQQIAAFTKHKLAEHSIDDRIKCNACDWFTFQGKALLSIHKNTFHMLGEKLTCPDCDYVSFNSSAMKKHLVKHSTVKKHQCKYCKKSFLRLSNLYCHERIHTGDKRKVCKVCGYAFVQRASLKYHMEKHHPEAI